MPFIPSATPGLRRALRVALSHYVLNGISVALGLLVISAAVYGWLGAFAASVAAVGVIVSGPPDVPAPRRGKFWHMLPAPLLGTPLFFTVQYLHHDPLALGLLLVPATFFIFLVMAWGKRGAPVAIALVFAVVFSSPPAATAAPMALTAPSVVTSWPPPCATPATLPWARCFTCHGRCWLICCSMAATACSCCVTCCCRWRS